MGQKIPRVMNFYKRFSRNIRSFLVENKIDMDTHIRKLSTDYRHTIQRFTEQIKVVPQGSVMAELLAKIGFKEAKARALTCGICSLYTGTK